MSDTRYADDVLAYGRALGASVERAATVGPRAPLDEGIVPGVLVVEDEKSWSDAQSYSSAGNASRSPSPRPGQPR
jgi:hypothetical protein